jgi:hypothetical protein
MDLYIYNPDIELQGVIDGYSSLRWRRRYFEPGEFELHAPATADNIALLTEGNIIHRLDRSEAGIVEGIKITTSDSTGEEITATGRMGSSMLDRRIIMPTINFNGSVEDTVRKIVSDNAITARPLPHLVLGTVGGFAPTATGQVTYKTALSAIEALSKAAPLGFRTRLDVPNKQWIFEVYDGVDRTVTQKNRPYILFSDEFRNIDKPECTFDDTGYANFAYVGGEGEGNNRVIVTIDHTGGEPRRELWVDAKDLQNTEDTSESFSGDGNTASFALAHTPSSVSSVTVGSSTASYSISGSTITISPAPKQGASIDVSYSYKKLSDAAYAAQLTQRGLEKLVEAKKSESFTAAAVDTQNFQYLVDWDLGDIVSFEKWGIRLDERITEVEEVDENGVIVITPTCGSPLPETLNLGDDN